MVKQKTTVVSTRVRPAMVLRKIKKLKLATLMISLQDISGLQPESQFWESCVFNPSFFHCIFQASKT